jgi:hypothetical protein
VVNATINLRRSLMRIMSRNKSTWLRRSAAAALVSSSVLLSTAVVALADNPNLITLTASCSNGQEMTVQLASGPGKGAFPSGLRLVNSSSVFTIHQFTLTNLTTGQVIIIKNDSGVANNKDLVSCSRTGNQYSFTWTGFFTPAS